MRKILITMVTCITSFNAFSASYNCRPQTESARDAATLELANGQYLICGHKGTDGCNDGAVVYSEKDWSFYECDSSGRNEWKDLGRYPKFSECNTDTVISQNLLVVKGLSGEYAISKKENTEALSSVCRLDYFDRCASSGGRYIGSGTVQCLCTSEYNMKNKNPFECECNRDGYVLDNKEACVPRELIERGADCMKLSEGRNVLYLCPFKLKDDSPEYAIFQGMPIKEIWPLPLQGDCFFTDHVIKLNDKIFCNDGGRIVEKPYACSEFAFEQIKKVPEEQRELRIEKGFYCWAISGQKSNNKKYVQETTKMKKQDEIKEPVEEVVDNKTGAKTTVKYNYQQCEKDNDCKNMNNTVRPYLHSTAWHCAWQSAGVRVCTATACESGWTPINGYCQEDKNTQTLQSENKNANSVSNIKTETKAGTKKPCTDLDNMDLDCKCIVAGTVERGGKCVCRDDNQEIKNGKCEWTAKYVAGLESDLDSKFNSLTAKIGGFEKNVWRDENGEFNTARLASDSIAGVVLGTVGGIVTANLVKKAQVKQGFEDIGCYIGGQSVAGFGDEFNVGR